MKSSLSLLYRAMYSMPHPSDHLMLASQLEHTQLDQIYDNKPRYLINYLLFQLIHFLYFLNFVLVNQLWRLIA